LLERAAQPPLLDEKQKQQAQLLLCAWGRPGKSKENRESMSKLQYYQQRKGVI
jgi:hypothetical protein